MHALDSHNPDDAFYLWTRTWEEFLQVSSNLQLNWEKYTGRASPTLQFTSRTRTRRTTQLQSDAEKALWRLLGLMQRHRQGRAHHVARET
eukprot:4738266-Amphidinium_carterae.1